MNPYPKYLDWLRYLSAYLLFTYGVSKLAGVQFTLSPDIARRAIGSLSGFQLTWYYYSYIAVGAECTATFLLASMLALLWQERVALLHLFWSQQGAEAPASRGFHRSMAALVVVIVIAQTAFIWYMRR
jgi:hypothetical protein